MRHRVLYAPRVGRDLENIRSWIAQESGSQEIAERFLRQLFSAGDSLATLPERFPAYLRARRWRMMPVDQYLVFFQVQGNDVRIGHIRHSARRPFTGT